MIDERTLDIVEPDPDPREDLEVMQRYQLLADRGLKNAESPAPAPDAPLVRTGNSFIVIQGTARPRHQLRPRNHKARRHFFCGRTTTFVQIGPCSTSLLMREPAQIKKEHNQEGGKL